MCKNFMFGLLIFMIQSLVSAQSSEVSTNNSDIYTKIGQEKVFVHYNTSLLFAGEYLYYKLYCVNTDTNLFSDISKIAYVELIGEEANVVFRQKVRLKEGHGQGDFFVPVSVPSGNYKLIGYTQWMKNFGTDHFFMGDLSIINPYTNAQRKIIQKEIDTVQTLIKTNAKQPSKVTVGGKIEISTNKDFFSKREKVSVSINSLNKENIIGDYSVSVRKKEPIDIATRTTAQTFFEENKSPENVSVYGAEPILPELRGELISGKVFSKRDSLPVENIKVQFKISGGKYKFKIATTNKDGVFYFNLGESYDSNNAILQVVGDDTRDYRIELNENPVMDYPDLDFFKLAITPGMKNLIVERSIHNQIENAYFNSKPDTTGVIKKRPFVQGDNVINYHLDDYTRFPTVKETIVEVIESVSLNKNRDGAYIFHVKGLSHSLNLYAYPTLVIVDGIMLQDFEQLVAYDARKIKTIRTVDDIYIMGSQIFQGIIDIETLESDYHNIPNNLYSKEIELFMPLLRKKYYKQVYGKEFEQVTNRIPDYRWQLLWKPDLVINSDEFSIDFFTSDISGEYEISLEGLTAEGTPVSGSKTIRVK